MSVKQATDREVHKCPWKSDHAECLTADCAEFGPRYRISQADAARLIAHVRLALASGVLVKGDRLPISVRKDFTRLCPRAFTEAISHQMIRDTLRGTVDISIDGGICYLEVTQ